MPLLHNYKQGLNYMGTIFFIYLQIRDYVRKHSPNFETRSESIIDECLNVSTDTKKFISHIYNKLLTISSPTSIKYKIGYEKDIDIQIPDDIWEDALKYIHSCSNNARHCLIQFKILHRLHYTKVKIHNIFQMPRQPVISVSPLMQHSFMLSSPAPKLCPSGRTCLLLY